MSVTSAGAALAIKKDVVSIAAQAALRAQKCPHLIECGPCEDEDDAESRRSQP